MLLGVCCAVVCCVVVGVVVILVFNLVVVHVFVLYFSCCTLAFWCLLCLLVLFSCVCLCVVSVRHLRSAFGCVCFACAGRVCCALLCLCFGCACVVQDLVGSNLRNNDNWKSASHLLSVNSIGRVTQVREKKEK